MGWQQNKANPVKILGFGPSNIKEMVNVILVREFIVFSHDTHAER